MTATFARLNCHMLGDRIDATYYRSEYIANELRLHESGLDVVPLSSLVTSGRRAVYFDTSTREESAAPTDWLPFLTADDFGADGFFLNLNSRRRVSPDFGSRYPNGRLRVNELLVKVKGPNQITAYNEREPDRSVLVSGTIWGALVRRALVDPYYLVTALSSTYAATARTRVRTNLNVEFLSPTDLMSLDLPLPRSKDSQTYIGNKVRQALRLRECANRIDMTAELALASALGSDPSKWVADCEAAGMWPNGGFRTRVSFDNIRGRIDPAGYHPELRAIGKRARSTNALFRRLPDVASIVTEQRKRIASDAQCNAYISILHVDERGVVDMTAAAAHRPDSDGRLCLAGDVLLSGINPAANRVGVCRDVAGVAACSPEFSILVSNHDIHPHYLAFVLRSKPCLRQLIHLGQGTSSSRRRIEEAELETLWVPIIANSGVVGAALSNAQSYRQFSSRLIDTAKVLVEQLINRSISDEQLSTAQHALDRGDRSLDRAILSRLTEDGLDIARKPPLFADLDALYAGIDEAQSAQPSSGDAA